MTTNLVKRNNGGPSFSNVMDQVFRNSLNRFLTMNPGVWKRLR